MWSAGDGKSLCRRAGLCDRQCGEHARGVASRLRWGDRCCARRNPPESRSFLQQCSLCVEVGLWSARPAEAVSCRTEAVFGGYQPSAFSVRIPGKGFGIRADPQRLVFRFLDKWSDPRNWQNEELPREGDTAWIPDGQAILVDVSPPRLELTDVGGDVGGTEL